MAASMPHRGSLQPRTAQPQRGRRSSAPQAALSHGALLTVPTFARRPSKACPSGNLPRFVVERVEAGDAATVPNSEALDASEQQQEQQQQEQHYSEDVCFLCEYRDKGSDGVEVDEPPGAIRWQKLPCCCQDRYLHVSCLETKFFDDAVLKRGRHQLVVKCPLCSDTFSVSRQRSRRSCDRNAVLSFARHLMATLLIAGCLLIFGLWSMLQPNGGRPNIVNVALLSIAGLLLLLLAAYEMWLLHCRFELVISRVCTNTDGQVVTVTIRH